MTQDSKCDTSGYYASRVDLLLEFLRGCEYEHEAKLCRHFIVQYLDLLISRGKPDMLETDASRRFDDRVHPIEVTFDSG